MNAVAFNLVIKLRIGDCGVQWSKELMYFKLLYINVINQCEWFRIKLSKSIVIALFLSDYKNSPFDDECNESLTSKKGCTFWKIRSSWKHKTTGGEFIKAKTI